MKTIITYAVIGVMLTCVFALVLAPTLHAVGATFENIGAVVSAASDAAARH